MFTASEKRRDFRIKFKDKQPVNKQIFGNFYRDVIFGGITDEYLFVFLDICLIFIKYNMLICSHKVVLKKRPCE